MTFREIVGHRRLKRLLTRAVQSGALPPSLIFAGPDGVGKRQMALALAQALNCLDPVIDGDGGQRDACGACPSCGKIARGLHPDVRLVQPEDGGSITVDQVRDVVAQTAYRPFEGRSRVVIVDQADLLGEFAQNALLKTLEEPPPRNVFILVTSRPSLLLTTVRSRCCVLRFAPLAAGEIAAALAARHGYGEHDARQAAALAGGSLARALQAGTGGLEDVRAVAMGVLAEAAHAPDVRARLAVGAALLKSAGRKGKDKEGKGQADRGSLAGCLRAMGSLLRDMTVLTTRASDAALVNLDLRADLEPLARRYDRDRLGRAFSAVGRSLVALERHNASSKIVVDWLALQL